MDEVKGVMFQFTMRTIYYSLEEEVKSRQDAGSVDESNVKFTPDELTHAKFFEVGGPSSRPKHEKNTVRSFFRTHIRCLRHQQRLWLR